MTSEDEKKGKNDKNKKRPIFPAKRGLQAIRESGYKNTASALAEIIDNSIDAESKNVEILIFEKIDTNVSSSRVIKKIDKIVVVDNGSGMNEDSIYKCLQIGEGDKDDRKKMGRFGVGLPQSSMSQCKKVEVYSWQNSKDSLYMKLDYDEVQETEQQFYPPPIKKEVPKDIIKNSKIFNKKNGTAIVWSNCDMLDIVKGETLFNHMNEDLCRIFRHYLDDDNQYGGRVRVNFIIVNTKFDKELKANDPLYTMIPNTLPIMKGVDYSKLKTNVTVVDKKKIPVLYLHRETRQLKKSEIIFTFTVAKPETQTLGGGSLVGKHYSKNTGISIVRKAREIDFGSFGYFNPLEEIQRWWGCEIRFEPILDEIFAVSNNKQSVRNIRAINTKQIEQDYGKDLLRVVQEDPTLQHVRIYLRYQISKVFKENHDTYHTGRGDGNDSISTRGSGSRSSISKKIANERLARLINIATRSKIEGDKKSEEIKKSEHKKLIATEDPSRTTQETMKELREALKRKIELREGNWPSKQFFTYQIAGETAVCLINRESKFYKNVYQPLKKKDNKNLDAIQLILMSFIRMEDELFDKRGELQDIRENWGRHLEDFLEDLKSNE